MQKQREGGRYNIDARQLNGAISPSTLMRGCVVLQGTRAASNERAESSRGGTAPTAGTKPKPASSAIRARSSIRSTVLLVLGGTFHKTYERRLFGNIKLKKKENSLIKLYMFRTSIAFLRVQINTY